MRLRNASTWVICLALAGCNSSAGDFSGEPQNQGPPGAPSDPPPTGSKWQGVGVEDACGRVSLEYVLVDEVCGGTDDPNYMSAFYAPIMRDGAKIQNDLFVVDANHLWTLDVSDPENIRRRSLLSGFGQPLAIEEHLGELLIAAGDEGLIRVDPTSPGGPSRVATLDLGVPALGVTVNGNRALVATGNGGVKVVDLPTHTVTSTLDVPGFAAAATESNGVAYVAACGTFAAIDIATGSLLGQTWLAGAFKGEVLIAPAKDVHVVGSVAFVAAGRFGVVAIDIADPSSPTVLGNCTNQADLTFYASGVRSENDRLFVAAGEWGVLPLDITNPLATCTTMVQPVTPPIPEDGGECSTEPPWEVLPWTESWSPPPIPPEGRDPLQTLPLDGVVYAFGDATRIGVRAVDARDGTDDALPKLGRYAEPRLTDGIALQGDRVLVAGRAAGVYRLAADGSATLETPVPEAKTARAAAFLGDGRWAVAAPNSQTGGGQLYIEGLAQSIPLSVQPWIGTMTAFADTVYVPQENGVMLVNASGETSEMKSGRKAIMPAAIARGQEGIYLSAAEWTEALYVLPTMTNKLSPMQAFDPSKVNDFGLWRTALPRKLIFATATGPVEVASLGGNADVLIHDAQERLPLPPGEYQAGASDGNMLYLTSYDRGRYRSMLVQVDLTKREVGEVLSFSGMATAAAASDSRLVVADSDRGLRVYTLLAGVPVMEAIVDLEVTP